MMKILCCFLFCVMFGLAASEALAETSGAARPRATAIGETLTLPSALREISTEAFAGDTALDEVVLPAGLKRIGAAAFKGSSLRRIYLPASLSYIAPDAFKGCSGVVGYGPDNTYASRFFKETEGLCF